jgi:glucosamine--fructose-6-phosphate aminotransferase (isomerizing)
MIHARSRRHDFDARRTGNRRRFDQSVHAQMIALYLFALYLGQLRGKIDEEKAKYHAQQLAELPLKIEHLLNDPIRSKNFRKSFSARRIFFISGAASIFRSLSKAL